LYRKVLDIDKLGETDKSQMFSLMSEFYDNVTKEAFYFDLSEKNYCILLYDEKDEIKGFSTQKLMDLKVDNKTIHGVFSGDTIIHKDHWGSLELYKGFCEKMMEYGEKYDDFYWFLISKGYKTYKMLPLFFKEFYPNYKVSTPEFEQHIMHAFGRTKFPYEYDEKTGVVKYNGIKDRLKKGVADIDNKHLKDKDIVFFVESNSGYINGDDIVCLTSLKETNIKKTAMRLFLGR
jgi:hypothetical protein